MAGVGSGWDAGGGWVGGWVCRRGRLVAVG